MGISPHKLALVSLGLFFTIVGVVGIFLPILPTTPFLLLAAYFFSRSSERFHSWLIHHRTLGPPIVDWQQRGVIRTRAKILAITLITVSFAVPLLMPRIPWWGKGSLVLLYIGLISFLSTRPSK